MIPAVSSALFPGRLHYRQHFFVQFFALCDQLSLLLILRQRITAPTGAGAVRVQRLGSCDILFSEAKQDIYIVPIDYHPEPLRISMADLTA
jgi:hypothetical protein